MPTDKEIEEAIDSIRMMELTYDDANYYAHLMTAAYLSMKSERDKYNAIAHERENALMGLKYYIDNPSAWDHFSQNVSNAIQDSVAVVDDGCMERALALREKES